MSVASVAQSETIVRPAKPRALLFTAFEPSGDEHASAVIAELKARDPSLPIFAWGGPKMAAAGATIVERTGQSAVMGVPGMAKIVEHTQINARIRAWLEQNRTGPTPVVAHIPVDSPAANGPICKIAKSQGLLVIHLVAPQIWAWGRWRIHKLRRITDMVLCMLPFEEEFFRKRNVPCAFVGHFLFDKPLDFSALDMRASGFGDGHPRIALMPGSRPAELALHFPILLDTFRRVLEVFPAAQGVVAATTPAVGEHLRKVGEAHPRGWPETLRIVTNDTDAAVRWCETAIVKSGTVTLQVAKQHKPMVVFYKKKGLLSRLLMRIFVSTKYFSLPNVLAHARIVPELVPHYGDHKAVTAAVLHLLQNPQEAQQQRDALGEITARFRGLHAAGNAADHIQRIAQLAVPSA